MSGAAAAVLILGVLVALVSLHAWSVQRQLASQSVNSLRLIVAVEQESVLDSARNTASLQAEANAALLLVQTTGKSTATLPVIMRMTHAYETAVSTEIHALLFGDAQNASNINIALGDPAFTALDSELATVGTAEASNAANGVTAAFVASIGLVSGSGVLILIFAIYARRRRHTIAIVGVGGTGSYILDQVAKTWVDRIVLIDGDEFENHNAYRAPGAAAHGVLAAKRNKAEYFAEEYSRMHTGITAHAVALTADNLHLLEGATFAFLAAADAQSRPKVMRWLRERGVPFIDVGMSFRQGEGGLTGMAKVTAYLPGQNVTLPTKAAVEPDEDDYSSNIQVAELNALNAVLAVIR